MRCLIALAGLLLLSSPGYGQDAKGRRYGVAHDPIGYPQATPAEAVQSVSKAAERGAAEYLLAQLAAPTTVDQRVGARSALIRVNVDKLLRDQRDSERARADIPNRLPLDQSGFTEAVNQRTTAEAFRGLVAGSRKLLRANPRTGRDLRRIAREGILAEADDRATYTLGGEPREVVLVKIGERWYVDDAQKPPQAAPAAPPGK